MTENLGMLNITVTFLATLLFLLWNSALLYWDIPEANFLIGSK